MSRGQYFNAITDDINLVGNEKSVRLYYSYTARYVNSAKDILGSGCLNFYADGSSTFHRGKDIFLGSIPILQKEGEKSDLFASDTRE
ncbi:MAG: hypothetical protein V7L25_18950 [Nostoc sp.]